MTAFLFDESHPDLEMFFGAQCAKLVIRALESIPQLPPYRILRGSLLHHRYCYTSKELTLRSESVSESGFASNSSGQRFEPNTNHLITIVCDLAETMCASGSSMSEAELQTTLAQKNIWAIVVQNLSNQHQRVVEQALSNFGPFLGWVKVDRSNPIHIDLFATSLFQDMFIDFNGICKLSEFDEGTDDRKEEECLLEEYGSKHKPRLLDYEDFLSVAPELHVIETPSERSQLSVRRVAGKFPGHRAIIGKALAHEFEAVGSFRTFSTSRPDDGIEFAVPEHKLTKYLLNLNHPDGGPKAQFFRDTLGIIAEDWRYLADQFCQAAQSSRFYRLKVTGYGVMHGAQVLIIGRNGRQAVLESGWKLEETGPAQFVTAYPGDESKLETLEAFFGRVPKIDCLPTERWKQIHSMAHSCGIERGSKNVPTPMVLEKWGTIWDGACGFGWVFLPDARTPFAKWVLRQGIGYASRPGVHISSKLQTQSVEKNYAYALGYAEVLKANGIECRADSRLD